METQEVLDEIHELGFFSYNKNHNYGYPILTSPRFTVHTDRINLFYQFMLDYIRNNINTPIQCYFTVYDAFREHSEPSTIADFVESTKELLQYYKGRGSANEPGRFIHPYNKKDIFPVFNHKVLAFGRHKNDLTTLMIPDTDFIKTKGYTDLRVEIDREDIDWYSKIPMIFWRGGIHGKGYKAFDSIGSYPRCQRKMLVDYSKNKDWINSEASYKTPKSEMLQYKYQIDIDGEVSSWSAYFWKMYSNSVVFKVDSHYEQWYYKELKEWVHYIPVKADLSDLEDKYKWALENDEKCQEIANNAKNFMTNLTYENVIKNYKIE